MTATSMREARDQSLVPFALGVFRIVLALLFVMHGTAALFGWPHGHAAKFGMWPNWWAGALELILGSLIAIGLFTRAAAFVASGMMAVAYFWIHFPDGFWPIVNDGEPAVLYCFVFLLLVFTGPGALAVTNGSPSRLSRVLRE
jgi:putative oxidoreductase